MFKLTFTEILEKKSHDVLFYQKTGEKYYAMN